MNGLKIMKGLSEYGKNNLVITAYFSKVNGSQAGILFGLKAYLTLRPYQVLAFTTIMVLLFFSLEVRIFEEGVVDNENRFLYISNAFWMIFQSYTLVSFGDIKPVSHLGRLFSVFACLSGVVALSLLVSALSTTTDFT
jgi:hypothetical protein